MLYLNAGEQELTQCCGVIIENDASNRHTVLTSAKLIRCRTEHNVLEDKLADSIKVGVYTSQLMYILSFLCLTITKVKMVVEFKIFFL